MTHTQVPGIATKQRPFLSERENQRAVDLIEHAERSAPYCLCGTHMIAAAHGDEVWLECSSRSEQKAGFSALVARATSFAHTRHLIMDLPTSS